ncbi:MAG: L,D-transpeptidase family protein [Flavisolibacter sp.]|nr:L,D-transpeptidase family protein [Flavisolibacter sp.]
MKKIFWGTAILVVFSSCTQVAGWFGHNSDSTSGMHADSSAYAAYARDMSITAANAYSDLFLDSNAVDSFIQKEKLDDSSATALRNFYRVRNYQYAWFTSDGPTEQARGLWSLYASKKDSLSKEPANQIKDRMDTLLQHDSITVAKNDSSFVQTELTLTQQLIQYASENPQHISKSSIYYLVPAKKMDAMEYADSVLNRRKDSSLYASNKGYNLLKEQLANYYSIAKNGGWGTIASTPQLKKGTKSPQVVALKKRLQLSKDYNGTDTSNVFSDSLETAVKSFQQRNGLQPNGVVNDSMINILNVPVEQRIEQVIVNMNRMLWMPQHTDSSRIEVSIPSQMLYVYADSGKTFEMPVVVGKEGSSTVMFSSQINQIVFSPIWHIPESIVRDEIMPKMKSDATYLKKNNIEVVKQNDSIPVLQQLPGKDNPLGKAKFLFPNTHDIYLHDTPNKDLFAKNNRTMSHGCIRVADAAKLAQYLLRDQSDWTAQKIQAAMNSGKEQTVELKTKQPVSITYLTAWVDKNGMMNFRPDVYNHDKEAMEKMFVSKS